MYKRQAQDGSSSFESLELLREAAKRGELVIDIEALPSYPIVDKVINNPDYQYGVLKNHFKINGFKFFSDGSPQGKTAFFGKAYLTKVPGCDHAECRGFPVVTQDQFNEAIIKSFKNNIQPYVNCNGDAAIDMYNTAVVNANKVPVSYTHLDVYKRQPRRDSKIATGSVDLATMWTNWKKNDTHVKRILMLLFPTTPSL